MTFTCNICGEQAPFVPRKRYCNPCRIKTRPLWYRWAGMLSRVKSEGRHKTWYLDQGITVDPAWKDFATFAKDMYPAYQEAVKVYGTGLDLDRADATGNYCKGNCRFISHSHNMRNRRKFKGRSRHKGVSFDSGAGKWSAAIFINKRSVKIGRYRSERNAAVAYNVFAHVFYGPHAHLNAI